MKILWEGPFFRPLSLDKVNRETVLEAIQNGHDVITHPLDELPTNLDQTAQALISLAIGSRPVDWHIRHTWPPYWQDRAGPLVIYQPWETGAVPDDWIPHLSSEKVAFLGVSSIAVQEMFVHTGLDEKKIHVIPHGVNRAIYHPHGRSMRIADARTTVILWVGGIVHRKGLDVLLEAYKKAVKPDDDVTLVLKVVGQTTVYQDVEALNHLNHTLSQPGFPHTIVVDQDLSEVEMAALYRRAALLVSPYRGEGFNLPVLEAMACGTLVAASDTNPTNEFLTEAVGWRIPGNRQYFPVNHSTKPGWTFECDPEALASILGTALRISHDEGERRRARGQELIDTQYTWRHVWKVWEAVLAESPPGYAVGSHQRSRQTIIWRGPVRNASGYASEARLFLKHLPKEGILTRLVDFSGDTPNISTSEEEALWSALERLPVDDRAPLIQSVPAHLLSRGHRGLNIARTLFETDRLPRDWIPMLVGLDAVLVASPFNVRTFADAGVRADKIFVVPGPIDVARFVPGPSPLPGSKFRFISVFDWSLRKGWDLLLEAWFKAFTQDDPVSLAIKLTNIISQDTNRELNQFIDRHHIRIEKGAPIQLIAESWTDDKLITFYQSASAFVLPTRGEGWGRPILEAMACNLPVIATYWSAPAHYLTEQNSLPIRVKSLTPVSNEFGPKAYQGHQWAEPDLDHLVHQLRTCAFGQPLKLTGVRETALQYSPEHCADMLSTVLKRFGFDQGRKTS